MVVDDEKFELSTICPGFILGPVLQGSSCTNMEVCDLFTLTSHAYVGYNFLFYVRILFETLGDVILYGCVKECEKKSEMNTRFMY